MGKRAIAIEQLLTWAYREQRVDAWWSGRKGLMAMERDVEAAVAGAVPVFNRSRLDQALLDAEVSADERRSLIAANLAPDEMPADALALHRLVLRLPREALVLAVLHARRGDRPDQLEGGACWAPADGWYLAQGWKAKRALAPEGARLANSAIHPKTRWPWMTWLRWEPDPRDVLAARTAYATWREGLASLAWYLAQVPELLRDHALNGELPTEALPLRDFERAYVLRAEAFGYLEGEPASSGHVVPGDPDVGEVGVKRRRWSAG